MNRISSSLVVSLVGAATLVATGASAQAQEVAVRRTARDARYQIPRELLGASARHWVATDTLRKSGGEGGDLVRIAKKAKLGSLRFPGGLASQNYNWITNRGILTPGQEVAQGQIASPANVWALAKSRRARELLNYREFVRLSRSVGAEPTLVVNIEGLFHAPSARIRGLESLNNTKLSVNVQDPASYYVKLAAEWVHDANVVRKLGVKSWEIGYESLQPGSRYPLSVKGYASLLRRFSRAMKAVDPTIQIGAHGPPSSSESGFVNQLNRDGLRRFRALSQTARLARLASYRAQGKGANAFRDELNAGQPGPSPQPWWPQVLGIAGQAFDFMVIHARRGPAPSSSITIGSKVRALAELGQRTTGAPKKISVSSPSLGQEGSRAPLAPLASYLFRLEFLGQLAEEGVASGTLAHLLLPPGVAQPGVMRLASKRGGGLKIKAGDALSPLRDFAPLVGGQVLRTSARVPGIYHLAVRTPSGRIQVLIVNRGRSSKRVTLRFPKGARTCDLRRVGGAKLASQESQRQVLAGSLELNCPAGSALHVRTNPITWNDSAYVHFIDLGHGDATLVEFPQGAVLIDAGGDPAGPDRVTPYLTGFFAKRPDLKNTLDLVVITHVHLDHNVNLPAVLGAFKVRNLLWNGRTSNKFPRKAMLDLFKKHPGIRHRVVTTRGIGRKGITGPVIDPVSGGAVDPAIRALWGAVPKKPKHWGPKAYRDQNNHSVTIRIKYGKASMLFTGDLETQGLKDLTSRSSRQLDVDLLKIGHHGFRSGTTEEFVRAVSPALAVLSRPHPRPWDLRPYKIYQRLVTQKRKRLAIRVRTFDPALKDYRYSKRNLTKAIYWTGKEGTIVVRVSPKGTLKLAK